MEERLGDDLYPRRIKPNRSAVKVTACVHRSCARRTEVACRKLGSFPGVEATDQPEVPNMHSQQLSDVGQHVDVCLFHRAILSRPCPTLPKHASHDTTQWLVREAGFLPCPVLQQR
eukprot:3401098-Rhodomonas_salina.1